MAFIDDNRDDVMQGKNLVVEPVVAVLRKAGVHIASSTYHAAKSRQPSARAMRKADLRSQLRQRWEANYRVYGARKLWKATRREGLEVGRDQVARLMRAEGIAGVVRTARVRTTRPEPAAARHPDLVVRGPEVGDAGVES